MLSFCRQRSLLKWLKNVVKKVTVRLTEEEKSAVIMLAKEENKSVQNFIYDRIMPAQYQQNADIKKWRIGGRIKKTITKKRRRNSKITSANWSITKIITQWTK